MEEHQGGQESEDGSRGVLRPMALFGVSPGKASQGRVHSLGLASLNNFGGLWAIQLFSGCWYWPWGD